MFVTNSITEKVSKPGISTSNEYYEIVIAELSNGFEISYLRQQLGIRKIL